MPEKREIRDLRDRTHSYLVNSLLPFWIEQVARPGIRRFSQLLRPRRQGDGGNGEAVPHADPDAVRHVGRPPGRLRRRALRRTGPAGPPISSPNTTGTRSTKGGIGSPNAHGKPTFKDKVGYGHCFGIYAFSEYFLATGDPRGREYAARTYAAVCKNMADTRNGGFLELMGADWQPAPPGIYGGDRKSLDVHMHMMEALTTFYEMTGHPTQRRRLLESIDLILTRMLRPDGTGYVQFTMDFEPLPAILFAVFVGARRQAGRRGCAAAQHDVPRTQRRVRLASPARRRCSRHPRQTYAGLIRKIADHCVRIGIDHEFGGVYADTPADAPTSLHEKQFWQQAEVLVGMLDAYELFGEEQYWRAFRNVYDFVFTKMVNMAGGGEWYERVDREGRPIDDALGHAWKICYHTVRSMIETIRRLDRLA